MTIAGSFCRLCAVMLAFAADGPVSAQELPEGASVIATFEPGSGPGQLGVRQPNGDDVATLPNAIAVVPGEGVVILDNVNLRLIRVTLDTGAVSIRNMFPESVDPVDLAARQEGLYLLDAKAVRVITPDFRQSDAVDNGAGARSFGGSQDGLSSIIGLTDEGASFVAPSDKGVGGRSIGEGANPVDLVPTLFNYGEKHWVEGRGIRLSPAQSGARSFERPDSAEDFDVAPADSTLDGVNVVGARIIRKSTEDRSQDVYVQELATKASQGVLVRTMVRRYRRDEGGLKFASVAPLGENQFGRNAVASDTDYAYQLLPLADEAGMIARFQLIKIPFRSATPEALRTLSFPRPKIDRLSDQDAARRKRQQICATADPLTTSQEAVYRQVLNAGRAYSTMPWRVTERSKGPDSCPNSSAPGFAKAPQIAVANVGDTLRGMPYGWGNFDSVDSFRRRVERQGIRAGNVCTNSGGGIPGSTAGIDCSGFVQRALNLPHRGKLGTSTMQPYMIDLGTFAALRPGDVLLKPGSHVMFYLGTTNGGIWTAESTTSCNRQRTHRGVCFVTRSFDFISGYRPARPVTNCSK